MSPRERFDWARLYNLLGASTCMRPSNGATRSTSRPSPLRQRLVRGPDTLQRIDADRIRDAAEFGRLSASIGAGTASMPDNMRQDLDAIRHDAGVPAPNI